ncbi:LSM domain-containing protein, putative [Eimeria necatrix]|uniref:LSM domain-containing protein, putative n=2 Tax=Eimeria TaxID=5800 RepID=U6MVR3_9EIME|nr:LSM domain-containing protein, putative [Eimeria tenella]XP_013434287.1 LSM domain-containing protein, putative [Eimeria necatrix]CDJ40771.1 LSM domain-containing protein, putative [Eimeria tenella]CDJ65820.1 LSM domain-containing protein, putative [Eimeria necatrix]|eukprot:XP_013231521.1 LSM domain-containing protein, putative [Eimeria tenella]
MKNAQMLQEPLDIARLSVEEKVFVKCRGERQLKGTLHSYDVHLNLVLADAEETLTVVDDATNKLSKTVRKLPLIFVRGDAVVLLSPLST